MNKIGWEKEFDKKYVVKGGTKRLPLVGYYTTQQSEIPDGLFLAETLKTFIRSLLKAQRKELVGELSDWLLNEGYLKENKLLPRIKPGHGSCCCCQECGRYHDECVCESNEFVKFLAHLKEREK